MTIYIWAENIYYFCMFSVVVPFGLGVRNWQLMTGRERWIVGFLGALLLHEFFAEITMRLHLRNHFLYYLQTLLVLGTVTGVYDGYITRKGILWKLFIGLSLSCIVEVVSWVGFNHINSFTLTLSRLLPAVCAGFSLHQLFLDKTEKSLERQPMIYMHLGYFFFGAFTAVNTSLKSYFIETSLDLYYLFDTMSAMVCILSFGFFSVGFLRMRSLHKSELS